MYTFLLFKNVEQSHFWNILYILDLIFGKKLHFGNWLTSLRGQKRLLIVKTNFNISIHIFISPLSFLSFSSLMICIPQGRPRSVIVKGCCALYSMDLERKSRFETHIYETNCRFTFKMRIYIHLYSLWKKTVSAYKVKWDNRIFLKHPIFKY